MTDDHRDEPERIRDRRIALEAAKRAVEVSPAMAPDLFNTIALAGHPGMTPVQLEEAYAIYVTFADRDDAPGE